MFLLFLGAIYDYAFEMGPGIKIHMPTFINIGSAILSLMGGGGGDRHTDTKTYIHRDSKAI
jgi:hypothetical protein